MPSGFKDVLFPAKSSNSFGLDQNCYYCTVAALLNQSVAELLKQTEIMQQDCANENEIVELFGEAGVQASFLGPRNAANAYALLLDLPPGESVGLGYQRNNGSRHMIVATRDVGYVNNFVNPGIKCVDYQASPPKVAGFEPEKQILRYWIFYRR